MNWLYKIVRLVDIAKINYGYTAKASFEGDGPKFLRITDIQNGAVNWHSVPVCTIDQADLNRHRLHEDDIVFARTGATTGKSYRLKNPPEAVAASYLIRLRIHDKEILPSFVSLFFQTTEYWDSIAVGTSGSAQGGFNASKLSELRIPKPPLPEQKRIVAILDEAFEGIDAAVANTEKNLANARELFESHLNGVFTQKGDGWVEKKLEENIRFIDYRGKTPKKIEKGLRLITAKNVRMGYLQQEPEEFVSPDSYDNWMTRGIPEEGDVLFTTEAPLGFVCQLDTSEKVVFAQRIITMQPDRSLINPAFLKYALRSSLLQSRIHEKATGATAQGIKASLLKKVTFPCAGTEEQGAVVESLDAMSLETQRLESIYQQKLEALTELKQSILQKAFAGELTALPEKDLDEAVA